MYMRGKCGNRKTDIREEEAGKRIERSSSSAKMPRTQLRKIDGLREVEDFGRTVPFELTVYPGEDVVAKLWKVWEASTHSSYAIAAFGHISKAAIGKPNSDLFRIYEGDFEILSLSGHYVNEEDGSADWRLGITLADSDSDREAFGGSSINTLIASDIVSVRIINFEKEEEKSDETGTSSTIGGVLMSLLLALEKKIMGFFSDPMVNESDKEN
ncbi:hypothetical protein HN51_042714 [Arachis hypogaea]|uniref:AT-hook motif nuclear-localized protein n=2 Tax=Arachis TaxID=3817 RepID=A0A444Y8K3_ARAHY|nr:hypothetical protein Ahy_B08g094339 [Arachis hypogaea]